MYLVSAAQRHESSAGREGGTEARPQQCCVDDRRDPLGHDLKKAPLNLWTTHHKRLSPKIGYQSLVRGRCHRDDLQTALDSQFDHAHAGATG